MSRTGLHITTILMAVVTLAWGTQAGDNFLQLVVLAVFGVITMLFAFLGAMEEPRKHRKRVKSGLWQEIEASGELALLTDLQKHQVGHLVEACSRGNQSRQLAWQLFMAIFSALFGTLLGFSLQPILG